MCDLLAAGTPLAVLVRGDRLASARQRIETVLARAEADRLSALPRPVVLEADLHRPLLGLTDDDRCWIAENCSAVIHSAASITFYADGADGEPWRTNVVGTAALLDLCRIAGLREFHHVSTAYVCGQRTGRVLEEESDVGQTLGNDYERSKLAAERLVREADWLRSTTIYRPSIIVGNSRSGYTSTFHGFYAPLQLAAAELRATGQPRIPYLDQLGLDGSEGKNLVPVDWVSAVITHLVQTPAAHDRTYHLTNPENVSAATIVAAISEAIAARAKAPIAAAPASSDVAGDDAFRQHMDVYRAYLRDDAVFDATNTRAAAAHLPCPRLDQPLLTRLALWALDANFGWPRERPVTVDFDVEACLESLRGEAASAADAGSLELIVDGPGGGQWQLGLDARGRWTIDRGMQDDGLAAYLLAETLDALLRGELELLVTLRTGRVLLVGDDYEQALRALQSVVADLATRRNAPAREQPAPTITASHAESSSLASLEALR